MRFLLITFFTFCFVLCHSQTANYTHHYYNKVIIETILEDSISIRAVQLDHDLLMYAGNHGKYGVLELSNEVYKEGEHESLIKSKISKVVTYDHKKPSFRAIASTTSHFYVLSIESPALLYKIDKKTGENVLVYKEEHDKVFYDSLIFWNDTEGIAMGDPTDGCLSIIITRDGGNTWKKTPCDQLPVVSLGEAAFAASNGNISHIGDHTWILSGGTRSRVFYSSNKGIDWQVFDTPLTQGKSTTGGYSIDFWDENNGIIYGGDYTQPNDNSKNKAITSDGGKTWNLVSDGVGSGYKSCVRYIPHSNGEEIIAVGFNGIALSNDMGQNWKSISSEGFYTIRFMNDSIAIATGENRIAKLRFAK